MSLSAHMPALPFDQWPAWAAVTLGYVLFSRAAELGYARANTRRLLAEGGVEHGRAHYPLFILLHGSWLVAIALLAVPPRTPQPLWLLLFVVSQGLRYWTLASIGRWWTTRIVSAPHFPRVRYGPYRWFPHPNYAVVVLEIAALPLLLGASSVALAWSIANAALLGWRIRIEEAVLSERRGRA